MRIDRTNWPPDFISDGDDIPGTSATIDVGTNPFEGRATPEYQPAFGISVMWNEPEKPWKPVLIVWFWRWRIQIGWLYE